MDPLELLEVQQRIVRAQAHVEDWKKNIAKWRNLYNLKHYKTATENENQYSDPTHTNAVDLTVGIILANKMRWHSYGFSPSKQEQTDTGKIEKLLQATWDINDAREERSNSYELILNFARDGGGVIYSVFDPVIASEKLSQTEEISEESPTGTVTVPILTESPLRVQIIDPNTVFMLPGGPKRWLLIGRESEMSIMDAMILYPMADFSKYQHLTDEDKTTTKGKFKDVWDYVTRMDESGKRVVCVRNTVMFDDIPLMGPQIMNGYKELPYSIQFYKPIGSHPASWQNVMSAQETSVDLLERTVNRRSKQIDIFTALPLVSKTQTGRVVQIDGGLFNHVQLGTDETIEFPRWQGNAPDVQLHIDFLRSRVNQSGFSEVMFGIGGGESAGYAISQLSDQNRIRLEQPIYHLELLLTTWAKKSLDLLLEFAPGMSICAYGQHKGKDYNEYISVDGLKGYAVKAEIRPSFPAEETRKVAMATQAKGILSDYSILERYFDIEQPEDEQERKLIEIVSANPVVIQYSILAELKERADNGDEIAAQVYGLMQQQMMTEQAGRPKDPNNPEQLTGTQSPTGEPVPQASGNPPPGASSADQMARAASASPNMGGGI